MSYINYFPDKIWLSKAIHFTCPSSSTWVLTRKISQDCAPFDEEEAKEYLQPPFACASFECRNMEDPEKKGIMEVEMQIPYSGTEFDPDRHEQASEMVPLGMRLKIKAYKLLHQTPSENTPKWIGVLQEKQASDSALLPGGSIHYLAYTAVSGICLGNGLCHRRGDGRNMSEGPYWEFSPEVRQDIRTAFQDAYQNMETAGVYVVLYGLKNLYWDRDLRRLFVYGTFNPLDAGIDGYPSFPRSPFGPKTLHLWGLAIPPPGKKNYDVAIADLEDRVGSLSVKV